MNQKVLTKFKEEVEKRYYGWLADEIYFKEMAKRAKNNSPEKVAALAELKQARVNISKDKLYLECIEAVIKDSLKH
jgi:hypothetical protein